MAQVQKQTSVMPPMRYELYRAYSSEIDYHLCALQSVSFTENPKTCRPYVLFHEKIRQLVNLNDYKTTWTFGYIPAPPQNEITRRIIGKDGCFLKMTTTLSGVDFIWHDRVTNTFLFWGLSTSNIVKAMNAIRWRIQKCYTPAAPATTRAPTTTKSVFQVEDISDISDDDYED